MRPLSRRVGVVTVMILTALALAASAYGDTVYSDRNAFLAHVVPGYYLESFSGLGVQLYPDPLGFSGNGFAYTASSAPDGLYPGAPNGNGDLSNDNALLPITLAFTGKPVTAVGGYLFGNDINGNYVLGNITIRLDDGTQVTVPNAALNSFLGITTTMPIRSLMIFSDEFIVGDDVLPYDVWPATDDFLAGTSVEEPGTFCCAGMAALFVMICGFRKFWETQPLKHIPSLEEVSKRPNGR